MKSIMKASLSKLLMLTLLITGTGVLPVPGYAAAEPAAAFSSYEAKVSANSTFEVSISINSPTPYNGAEFGVKLTGPIAFQTEGVRFAPGVPATHADATKEGIRYLGYADVNSISSGNKTVCTLKLKGLSVGNATVELVSGQVVKLIAASDQVEKRNLSLPGKVMVSVVNAVGGNGGSSEGGSQSTSGSSQATTPAAVTPPTTPVPVPAQQPAVPSGLIIEDEGVALGAPGSKLPAVAVQGMTIQTLGKVYKVAEASGGSQTISQKDPSVAKKVVLNLSDEQMAQWSKLGVYGFDAKSGTWKPLGGLINEKEKSISFNSGGMDTFIMADGNRTFKDVKADNSEGKAILALAAKGLLSGKSQDQFKAKDPISRAEIAALLVKAAGLSGNQAVAFKDLGNAWYKKDMEIAGASGIMSGSGGNALPNKSISREELAVLLAKTYAYCTNEKLSAGSTAGLKDSQSASSWSKDAISAMYANGVMTAHAGGKFDPKAPSTRGETAEALFKLLELIMKA